MELTKYLAKSSGLDLLEHTRDVTQAAQNVLNVLPIDEEEQKIWLPKLLRCALLHDIGKIHKSFQHNLTCRGEGRVCIRHELISLWICEKFLNMPEDELFAIATHHKEINIGIQSCSKNLSKVQLGSDFEFHINDEFKLLLKEVPGMLNELTNLKNIDLIINNPDLDSLRIPLSDTIHKLLIKESQKEIKPSYVDRINLAKMRALLMVADHIGSARKQNEIPSYKTIELIDFQPKNKDTNELYSFRAFQQKLQNVYGDVLLYAPTGSGKTEASLCWLYANQSKSTRLFYLLPYTASINAMVKRLKEVFGKERVTALHSKTLDFFYEQLMEEASNEGVSNEFYSDLQEEAQSRKSLSKELYYPVKVATPHQILKSALMGKGWEMSLFEFKNACFIVDEFHTYDALMTGLLIATIKWLKREFNSKIFFMSATIPNFMKDLILKHIYEGDQAILSEPSPLEQSDLEILDKKRHLLKCVEDKYLIDFVDFIQEKLTEGKTVLVVVNNVKTAQKIFQIIKSEKFLALMLHSGFNKRSRIQIEEKITNIDKNERPQLLIGTQAIEVSLDIDYDIGFVENAPIDALIQRFGRINRTGNKGQVPVYLFKKIMGKTPFYDNKILEATWTHLQDLNEEALSERELVEVCNKVYEHGYSKEQQEDFEKGLNNSIINYFREKIIAGHSLDWIEDTLEGKNQKIEVLCGNLVDEFKKLKRQGLYIKANQLLVPVYSYELEKVGKFEDKRSNVFISNGLHYCEEFGYQSCSMETII
jgi:CRISPR-associated endonuclease/helicase Cas3